MLIELKYLINKYKFTPKGIIHCGAHLGEEHEYYKQFNIDNVIWIEANPDIYSKLIQLNTELNYKFHNNLLWSESKLIKNFNITNNGQSSSILEMGKHKQYYPEISNVESIELETITLDDLFENNNYNINDFDFINLDLQGVELDVLTGFSKNISKLKYIYTEINTGEVYKECSLLKELDSFLEKYDFIRVETAMTRAEWGDAFYVKR
jgi:FkbM family methyltransferase